MVCIMLTCVHACAVGLHCCCEKGRAESEHSCIFPFELLICPKVKEVVVMGQVLICRPPLVLATRLIHGGAPGQSGCQFTTTSGSMSLSSKFAKLLSVIREVVRQEV